NFRMRSARFETPSGRAHTHARGRASTNTKSLGALGIIAVEPLAHFLAGLEERDALLIDRHMGAGARIAPGACGAMLDRECTKTAQLHAVAARQGSDDLIENRVHDILDVPLVEVRVVLGNTLNKLGFDHRESGPGKRAQPFP